MDKFENAFWKAVVAKVANTENGEIKEIIARDAWDANDSSLLDDDELFTDDFKSFFKTMLDRTNKRMKGEVSAETVIYPKYAAPDAETLPPRPAKTENFFAKKAREIEIHQPQEIILKKDPKNFIERKAEENKRQLKLPTLGEKDHASPSLLLRSAIFGVIKKGQRKTYGVAEPKLLSTPWLKDATMVFSGEELDQNDLDVFMALCYLAAQNQVGEITKPQDVKVVFSDYKLLALLGRNNTGPNREWLRKSITRLEFVKITLIGEKPYFNGDHDFKILSLVRNYTKVNGNSSAYITVESQKLMSANYTVINVDKRRELSGDLTRWLHGFIQSHATGQNSVNLSTLQEISGVHIEMKHFKREIKAAIERIWNVMDGRLGLVKTDIVDGSSGPKLIWERRQI